MGYKIGICGLGNFGRRFIHLFQAHPYVDEVCLAELNAERLKADAGYFKIKRTFPSLDELCKSDVDAIALFTQRWIHGPQVVQALKAGKHVYSAVPMAVTLEEVNNILETVDKTGLIYMTGETSYYRAQTIYCQKRFLNGDFGKFVYGEGHYYHDMSHFYKHFRTSGGPDWKKWASVPPMWYPTHSVSHILAVTGERMTKVSCFGYKDNHPDGIFKKDISEWGNEFSNQTAIMRTSDGGMARINEFRRTSAGESRMSIFGTSGTYEEQTDSAIWTSLNAGEWEENINEELTGPVRDIDKKMYGVLGATLEKIDLTTLRDCDGVKITEYTGKEHLGVSAEHPVERLPKEFVGLTTGHAGSHQFLTCDFLESIKENKLPPNHAWASARYMAPGIVAHESSLKDGELMDIPDFGKAPEKWELLSQTVYR